MKTKDLFIVLITTALTLTFGILIHCESKTSAKTNMVECNEIRQAYANLLYRVWIDNPTYVEDVLNETDEWCNVYSLVGQTIMPYQFKTVEDSLSYVSNLNKDWVYIQDSTYHKMRTVFPDLPAEQAKPIK